MDDATLSLKGQVSPRRTATPRRRLARLALGRSWPSFAAMGVICGVLIGLAFDSGGYFPTSYLTAGAVVFAALTAILVAYVPHWTFPTAGLVALACLAGYAAWSGFSAVWSPDPAAALQSLQRDALYVGLLALGLIAAGSGRHARLIPWAALIVIFVVCGAGLISRLAPDIIQAPAQPGAAGRLSYPLSYWNTYGAMAAMGIILALGLASDAAGTMFTRAAAAVMAVPLGAAIWFSLSRGSWLALIVGIVVLVTIGHRRGSLLMTFPVVAGFVLLVILRARSYDALTTNPNAHATQSDGHALLFQILLLAAFAGGLVAVLAAGRRSAGLMQASRRVLRPIGMAIAGVLILGAIVVYAAKTSVVEGESAKKGSTVSGWVSRQWHEFLQPVTYSEGGTARLTTAKGTRSDLFRVAFDGFEGNPLIGDGAGGFTSRWFRERDVREIVINAHSLEFETLGELGIPGALLLLGFLGAVGTAATRARLRPGGMGRAQAATVTAALSVWLVHSCVDWDWQMPALTGVAIFLAASLFPEGRKRVRRTRQAPTA